MLTVDLKVDGYSSTFAEATADKVGA